MLRRLPQLAPIILERGQVLYHPEARIKKRYFVNRGLIYLVRTMRDGRTVEVGTIGIEGLVGFSALFGISSATLECIVQVPGDALCGDIDVIHSEVARGRNLATLLYRYYAHDSAQSDSFLLTHEFLAMMLGVQRAGVSIAAKALQQAGLIRYFGGHITITDRAGLQTAGCE
jgi:CRP-like cAMP-binding protein